ncbi:MAG TPA: hypothetical protein VK853_03590 [Ilumatobacteraceae bacterium]|nr:hypothetical protein [Ilumatobacteraceae bacterium]
MSTPDDSHPEPVTVGAFGSVGEAEIAQAKLRAFDIESVIVDNEEGGTVPVAGETIQLEVRATDADTARQVLSD